VIILPTLPLCHAGVKGVGGERVKGEHEQKIHEGLVSFNVIQHQLINVMYNTKYIIHIK